MSSSMQPMRPQNPIYAAPPIQTMSTWENPLEREVILDLHVGTRPHSPKPCEIGPHGLCVHNHSGKVRYVVPPAKDGVPGRVQIPSEFDRAIHDVRDGIIVGGLGTCLRKSGEEDVVLHPSLDDLEAKRKAAIEAAAEAERHRLKAHEDLELAKHELAKQNAEIAKNRAQQEARAAKTKE